MRKGRFNKKLKIKIGNKIIQPQSFNDP